MGVGHYLTTDSGGFLHPAHNACYIAGIYGNEFIGSPVVVKSDGQLGVGVVISSARFKDEIKPMDKTSEAILALKPVTFRYKKELDPKGIPQFGLVAEDVEKVNPDLVARDRDGKPYTVRYDAVNAMLLNEFLKEHHRVQEQEATIAQLKQDFRATVAELNARLKEQDSKIEKVSAQVEVSKPAPQVVNNNQ
jgi:predicted ribosome quality control (RQC) complex YloA/Tae2 family protein